MAKYNFQHPTVVQAMNSLKRKPKTASFLAAELEITDGSARYLLTWMEKQKLVKVKEIVREGGSNVRVWGCYYVHY